MIFKHIFLLFGTISVFKCQTTYKPKYAPNLPAGPYVLKIDALYPCESTVNHKLAFNIYLSRKSLNFIEIKGNLTFEVPFDDSISVDLNMAVMSSMGGWKSNAFVIKLDNACDKFKYFLGNFWYAILRSINHKSSGCPVPTGTHVTHGLDVTKVSNNNFVKEFFYGKYKTLIKMKNKNQDFLGCLIAEIRILRPWE